MGMKARRVILEHRTRTGQDRPKRFRGKPQRIWVATGGGPLLFASRESLHLWEGSCTPSRGRTVSARFRWRNPHDPATDYDRACDVGDIGVIEVGGQHALVLGDDPNSTTWIAQQEGGCFVRWVGAETESDIFDSLAAIEQDWQPTKIIFQCNCPEYVLFDSASRGTGLPKNHLKIPLATGPYSVERAIHDDAGRDLCVVLYRLVLQ